MLFRVCKLRSNKNWWSCTIVHSESPYIYPENETLNVVKHRMSQHICTQAHRCCCYFLLNSRIIVVYTIWKIFVEDFFKIYSFFWKLQRNKADSCEFSPKVFSLSPPSEKRFLNKFWYNRKLINLKCIRKKEIIKKYLFF